MKKIYRKINRNFSFIYIKSCNFLDCDSFNYEIDISQRKINLRLLSSPAHTRYLIITFSAFSGLSSSSSFIPSVGLRENRIACVFSRQLIGQDAPRKLFILKPPSLFSKREKRIGETAGRDKFSSCRIQSIQQLVIGFAIYCFGDLFSRFSCSITFFLRAVCYSLSKL